jgi:CelD/BcsL family acetyltransferase involved in cellulose biosynthesis
MKTSPRSGPDKGVVKVVPIAKDTDFFGMEKAWTRLHQESRTATIFLTWEWLASWWRAYGSDKELYILGVKRDDSLIGLAPFYRKRLTKFGLLSFQALALLGDGSSDSDYLDWISREGDEAVVTAAIVDFLTKNCGQWDLMFVNEIPEISPHLPALRKHFSQRKWHWQETIAPCTYVELPASWETYLLSLRPRMRTKIRSLTKRLEQGFHVRFDRCQQADDLHPRLESLFELHHRRWRQEGREGVFVDPAKRLFYQEMASRFLARGWLRFYSLAVDDRYVAHQFCFEYQNSMFLLQEGYAPEWAEHGVGNVLRAYVLRDCIERKVAIYDFLGGVTPHKLSWGAVLKSNLRISAGPPTSKNRVAFALSQALDLCKKGMKTILPDAALAWARSSIKTKGAALRHGNDHSLV